MNIIIGGGISGLSTAFRMKQLGMDFQLLERTGRTGGLISTVCKDGFVMEGGPNTGVVKYPEVAELFEALGSACTKQEGRLAAKRRLIWKGDRFRALPSGLLSALSTPLFTLKDKFRILGEPWRPKGTDPNESVAALTVRRLGKSYLDYAVDPFLSGVYAAKPECLPTRWALPKLYALEQDYGSFIRGAIQKAKLPKTERDRKATKNIFSSEGGFQRLVDALTNAIGMEHITLNAELITIRPAQKGFDVSYQDKDGQTYTLHADNVITTCPAYALETMLPFVDPAQLQHITSLRYAPVVQVGIGISDTEGIDYQAFGGLAPSCEHRDVLGILFPSACFDGRAPKGGANYSLFIGGMRRPDLIDATDDQLRTLADKALHEMLKYPAHKHADVIEISRHACAIPQYEANTGERLAAIDSIQKQHPGLILAGNIRDGIGMGDRIKQGYDIANALVS